MVVVCRYPAWIENAVEPFLQKIIYFILLEMNVSLVEYSRHTKCIIHNIMI